MTMQTMANVPKEEVRILLSQACDLIVMAIAEVSESEGVDVHRESLNAAVCQGKLANATVPTTP